MTLARSLNRALDRLEEFLTAAFLAIMTLLTFSQVVLRYVFDTGLVWLLEATIYLFSWLVLVGISIGIRTDSHIAVEFVTERLTPRVQRLVALAAVGLSLLYAVLMFSGSFTLVRRLYDFGSLAHDIPLPRWVLLSSLPIGFALLGLRLGQAAFGIWQGARGPLGHRAEETATQAEGELRESSARAGDDAADSASNGKRPSGSSEATGRALSATSDSASDGKRPAGSPEDADTPFSATNAKTSRDDEAKPG